MLNSDMIPPDSAMLTEMRAYLHMEEGEDDPSLPSILLAATGWCEQYLRQFLIRRRVRQILPASTRWQSFDAQPVMAVESVSVVEEDGTPTILPPGDYEVRIRADGIAEMRLRRILAGQSRVEMACQAGIATGWAELPELLRLGIMRVAAHYFAHRDGADPGAAQPPVAATILLRPWRRMDIGGRDASAPKAGWL